MVEQRLPRFQCHKVVEAAPIILVDVDMRIVKVRLGDEAIAITVPGDFFARGVPEEGDFFVRYDESYLSWSPALVFRDGYRRVMEEAA